MSRDERTRWTAGDSFVSKYQAIQKKYYADEFAEAMFNQLQRRVSSLNTSHKSPLINRGYYARVLGNQMALDKFIEATTGPRQLLFLGVGYDTFPITSFLKSGPDTKVFEIDFPDILARKHDMYLADERLAKVFSNDASAASSDRSMPPPMAAPSTQASGVKLLGQFALVGVDIRQTDRLVELLLQAGWDRHRPTIVFTECVMVYIDREHTEGICRALGDMVEQDSVWVSYDMINPDDRYGKIMVQNLTAAGFHIPGITDFPTLAAEANRFLSTGWTTAHSCTMHQFYNRCITAEEKLRIKDLEMVDEVEEWNMIMDHYSLTIAVKNGAGLDRALESTFFPQGK